MKYRNSTYAFIQGLQNILTTGQSLNVRGSDIIEIRNRVTVIEKPRERCVILPGRNNNIFACIAETIWVLAGRNDLDFLSHYLPRAIDFSDDGRTWRAAYGPRLRNWYGIDQLRENLSLLRNDLNSRRVVMSIFDPAADFVNSKDIPCNNWIHWLVRDGKLHMNVAIRSNDIVWGFSGINTFEWSVLQELMAFWLDVEMGEMTFFASSFHLYAIHKERAKNITEKFPGTTCYEIGLFSPRFQTPWDDFEKILLEWFDVEKKARTSPGSCDELIRNFPDPLLKHFLELLQLYNGFKHGWKLEQIDERLSSFPETDLTTAAYEHFHRQNLILPKDIPHIAIARFWSRYIRQPQSSEALASNVFCQAIIHLHTQKTAAYGPSWKRRGEQISIMSNIARKVDRLERVAEGAPVTRDESLFDTAVDLFVYCIKYQTYLADIDDDVAARLLLTTDANLYRPYSDGVKAFNYLISGIEFGYLDNDEQRVDNVAVDVVSRFQELEQCFAGGTELHPVTVRLDRLLQLTRASVKLLLVLKRDFPDIYSDFLVNYTDEGVHESG